jgi:hypothetical protein
MRWCHQKEVDGLLKAEELEVEKFLLEAGEASQD